MRDAVGGTFMIYVFLIFLAVYITFTAVALNYAKAFRVKNSVIDIIEQNEGIDDFNNTSGVIGQINNRLKDFNYNVTIPDGDIDKYCNGRDNYFDRGYCISEVKDVMDRKYYQVVTFVQIQFPIFDNLTINVPIKGETRMIERINT